MEEPQKPEILELLEQMFKNRYMGSPHFPIAADHYDTLMTYALAIQDYRRAKGEHPYMKPIHTRGPGHPLHFHGEEFATTLIRREDLTQPIPENWRAKFEVDATKPSPRDDHEARQQGPGVLGG